MSRLLVRLVAFTLVCIGFTAWLAFTIGNLHPLQRTYPLSATFDDVTGLLRDDNVKVAGVVVGKVTGVRVERGRAVVDFVVRREVKLPSDTEAAVRWRNLLGQRYVYLYPGRASTILEPGDHIPVDRTKPVVDIGELFNRLGPIVNAVDPKQVNAFLDALTGALQGNEAGLSASIHDLAQVASTLGQRDQAIGRLVEQLATLTDALASRDGQIRTILDNLTTVASTFNANTDVLDRASVDLSDLSGNLARLLAQNRPGIDRIIANLGSLAGVIDNRMGTLDRTVAGLDELSLALYNASRWGQWLNQFIPCVVVDFGTGPVNLDSQCASRAGGDPTAATQAGGGDPPAPNPVTAIWSRVVGVG